MNKLRKGIKRIVVACFAVLIVTGTSKVVKAYAAEAAANLSVTIDTGSVTLKDTDRDGAYEISNANELYAFAAAVNGVNNTINGELTANITVNTGVLVDGELANNTSVFRVWTPIGSGNEGYKGEFDGNNHTVSGLYISSNDNTECIGFIGNLYTGGTVQNLGVIDSYFHGYRFVGGIVGGNINSTITNCYNTGIVSGISEMIGGIAGHTNAGTISDCYNSGTVISSGQKIGGIVGYSTLASLIEKCYNTGSINISYGLFVGGVIGENFGTVANCYNNGSITCNDNFTYCGGVIGKNDNYALITNCFYLTGCVTSFFCGPQNGIGSENPLEPAQDEKILPQPMPISPPVRWLICYKMV